MAPAFALPCSLVTAPLSGAAPITTCRPALSWQCSLTAPPAIAPGASSLRESPLPNGQSHFLHVDDWSADRLEYVLDLAGKLKLKYDDTDYLPLKGKAMSMIFAKPSARTRVSFETGMYKLGGHALCLGPEVGVGTREEARDVSRVLAGMTDIQMARLYSHKDLMELAKYSSVPVINGLTDYNHPCQIMADVLTIIECGDKGKALSDTHVVYIGDGNNIVHSWLELAAMLSIRLTICVPNGYEPNDETLERARAANKSQIIISNNPMDATKDADFIYTDVWASMGQKEEISQREKDFSGFQVTTDMFRPGNNTKFLHCLPAERGREVSDQVMEAPYSVVFQEAENRMHAQNAIILACLGIA